MWPSALRPPRISFLALRRVRPKMPEMNFFECQVRNVPLNQSIIIWTLKGVHLSFVRSATMDKWKPSELEKMKVGGNKKLNEFLEEHDDFNEQWTIGTVSFTTTCECFPEFTWICLVINESKMKNIILKVLHCTEIKYLPKLKEMWVLLWSLCFFIRN